MQFDFAKDGLLARGHPIAVPPGIRTLPKNRGLEALEYVPQNQPMGGTQSRSAGSIESVIFGRFSLVGWHQERLPLKERTSSMLQTPLYCRREIS
jgi:hypothetical protein